MRNQELLQNCNSSIIAIIDYLETYAKKKGCEVIISSGYRTPEANDAITTASKTSDHTANPSKAVDLFFSDAYNIFEHITFIYQQIRDNVGVFANAYKLEVVRDVYNNKWTNHIHISADKDFYGDKIYFTGIY